MLLSSLFSTALPMVVLAMTTSASPANWRGIYGKQAHPPAPAAPVQDPECVKYEGGFNVNKMTQLKVGWGGIFTNGDAEGYQAAYGGKTLSIQTGWRVPGNTHLFVLETIDPETNLVENWMPYLVGRKRYCTSHRVPNIYEKATKGWKVNVYVTSLPVHTPA